MVAYVKRLPLQTRQSLERELNGTKRNDAHLFEPREPLRRAHTFEHGQRKGHEAEERFLRICETAFCEGRFPAWLSGVSRGTYQEDSIGIDMVACAGVHRIPIQIKSSSLGREKFLKRPDRVHIICIVVATTRSDEEIFLETLEHVSFVWDAIQRAMADD